MFFSHSVVNSQNCFYHTNDLREIASPQFDLIQPPCFESTRNQIEQSCITFNHWQLLCFFDSLWKSILIKLLVFCITHNSQSLALLLDPLVSLLITMIGLYRTSPPSRVSLSSPVIHQWYASSDWKFSKSMIHAPQVTNFLESWFLWYRVMLSIVIEYQFLENVSKLLDWDICTTFSMQL